MIKFGTNDSGAVFDAILRQDLVSFIGKSHQMVSPGSPYQPTWHIEAIAHRLTLVAEGKVRRLLITVPPRSMKSTCVSIAFVAWLLGHDPRRRIICASYGGDLATKFSSDTRRVMESALYRRCFPGGRLRRATENELVTLAGGSRRATSVGGVLTGHGADLIIIDDPNKADDANSRVALARTLEWFDGTLLSRLDDKANGAIIIVMQRLHVEDLAGHVLKAGGWDHLDLPAIAVQDALVPLGQGRVHRRCVGDMLQPQREPLAVLEELKRAMGSAAFSAQYQQAPVPHGGNMIDWSWLDAFDLPLAPKPQDEIIQSWDTASSAGELADFSVGMTFVVRGDHLYLVEVVRERLTFPDLKRAVLDARRRHRPKTILIEEAGSGMALIQELKDSSIAVKGIRPEGDKVMRMAAETARLEAGVLHVPMKVPWLDELRAELLAFPHAAHDDQADALSQALKWVRTRNQNRGGWGYIGYIGR